MDSQPQLPVRRRRRRPALSCLECRRRKIKCDRNEPCNHCTTNKTQCVFNKTDRQPQLPDGITRQPENSVPATQAHGLPTPTHVHHSPTAASGTDHSSNVPSTPTGRQDTQDLLRRIQRLESASRPSTAPGGDQTSLPDSLVYMKKSRVAGWYQSIELAPELQSIVQCWHKILEEGDEPDLDERSENLVAECRTLGRQCKDLTRVLKRTRPSKNPPDPYMHFVDHTLQMPSPDLVHSMASVYFESFESHMRILHVPSFWDRYNAYKDKPDGGPMGFRLVVLLVVALGACLSGRVASDAEMREMAHRAVYAAQSWLSGPLDKDRIDLTGLQVHCLTIIARQILCIGGDLVWVTAGSLLHQAMQTGLHRDPRRLPPMTVLQAEQRRRLWATVLELVVQSSLSASMPPSLSLDDFDTEPPANLDDAELARIGDGPAPVPRPRDIATDTSMQLLLLDSLPTRLRISRLINGLHDSIPYADVLALTAELDESVRSYRRFMARNAGQSRVVGPFHRQFMDSLVRRFVITLHMAFLIMSRTNPMVYYSRKASVDAAMALLPAGPELDPRFRNLTVISGGILRDNLRGAETVLVIELLFQAQSGTDETTAAAGYAQLLGDRLRYVLDLSLERVRNGETNVKNHMYVAMALAEIWALENGVDGGELSVHLLTAARDSMALCLGLLERQASVLTPVSDGGFVPEMDDFMDFDFNMLVSSDWT